VDSRKEIAFDDNYKGAIYGISFDTTGRIATTSIDGKLRLYDPDLKLIRDARAPGPPEQRPFQIASRPTTSASLLDTMVQTKVDRVWML
jgi:sugar lactone lactonase YvrE